jgi:20S proteasome alpha/beta subunit
LKDISAQKISALRFANGTALIAESGLVSLSNRAIDILRKKAANTQITDGEEVPKVLEEALREVRADQMSLYPQGAYAPDKWNDFFGRHCAFEIMLAHYQPDGTPRLYSMEPSECIVRKPTTHFTTSGCGADLAHYVLSEHAAPGMHHELGILIAILTVETVIRHNAYCDHPTRVGLIHKPCASMYGNIAAAMPLGDSSLPGANYSDPVMLALDEIEELAEIIRKTENETRTARNKKLLSRIRQRSLKIIRKSKGWVPAITQLKP